ncbi:MAG: hypothetical protein M1827_001036 [Pycnora praestabilis]|nr:MAG: hypothetical protein M1827_001036 [Pycnora praestabilis]
MRSEDANSSRQGLLSNDDEASTRAPFDEPFSLSSDDDEELDELDPLNNGTGEVDRSQLRRGFQDDHSDGYTDDKTPQQRRRTTLRAIGRGLSSLKRCALIVAFFFGGLVVIIAGGGGWVYKTAPKDGLSSPWYPSPAGGSLSSWEESYRKAEKMVKAMTLVEKVNITTGTGWEMGLCVGNTGPANSVGFPGLCLQDGPLGIRFADNITAFPAGVTTGATWNKDLMYRRGRAHGLEARLKGVNVLLGPSMGPLGRMPAGGRNWEGFGPDPVLQGVAAAATINGIQDEGVIATAKHYILNEQEHFRQSFEWGLPNAMSSNIDDRTLHELYLWPFADSVRAGVGSVMCSYQMVNNSYACGNSKLLNGILKDELGFQGFMQSDWLAQRSGVASALAGLDMTMPGDGLRWMDGNSLWGTQLTKAALNSSLPMDRLNDMVTRVVAAWYQLGQDDPTPWPKPPPDGEGGPNFSSWTNEEIGLMYPGSPDDHDEVVVNKYIDVQREGKDSHGALARQIAVEGTVLVKNEDYTLPLGGDGWSPDFKGDKASTYKIAVIGEDARAGRGGPNACADRGCNQGTLAQAWGSGSVEFPYLVTPLTALKSAFNPDTVHLTDYTTNDLPFEKDSSTLQDQDLCLVFTNSDAGEGYIASDGIRGDRNDLYTQKGGDEMVQNVAKGCHGMNASTIVIVHAVGPVVLERWIEMEGVKAVILANLPGEESGNALVDILLGNQNPSGKLPYTVGKTLSDYGPGGQILYYPNGIVPQQDFTEGLYIDYRHFDKHAITPRYEFGFGLSYTTFTLTDLAITPTKPKSPLPSPRPSGLTPPTYSTDVPPVSGALFPAGVRKLSKFVYPYINAAKDIQKGKYPYPTGYDTPQPPSPAGGGEGGNPSLWDVHAEVSVILTNTGERSGQEVVQLYLSFPGNVTEEGAPIDFPVKVLRNFEKIMLEAGESQVVTMNLTRKDLSYWSVIQQNWIMPVDGHFKILVGNSSRNLPLEGLL